MNRNQPNTRHLLRFPLIFSGIFIAAGVGFFFRRSLFGDLEEQSDTLYRGEDKAGQELLKLAMMESWTSDKKKL